MRTILLAILFLTCGAAAAQETTTVCIGGRCLLPRARATTVVVHESRPAAVVESYSAAPVVIESAPVEHYHSPQPVTTVVRATPRRVTVATSSGAQAHAEACAASGRFVHARNFGGGYEGIGWGASPEAATRSCCYWGRRPVREIGTAWCPARRQWFAVVRYQ